MLGRALNVRLNHCGSIFFRARAKKTDPSLLPFLGKNEVRLKDGGFSVVAAQYVDG
jgi:hypothetical protein